jgi:hypothetical protein
MDTDAAAVTAFNTQAAQIAAEVTAQLEGNAVPSTPVVSPVVEPAPTAAPQGDPIVAKLLAKLTDMEAQIAGLKVTAQPPAPVPTPPENPGSTGWEDFHDDPWAAMEKRGMDVSHIARSIVARVMGNDAPPELKAQAAVGGRMAQLQTQVSDLMGQVKSLSSELGKRDYYSQIEAHSPAADSTPATSAMLAANPQWVKDTVKQVVAEDARARSTIPGAKPLTPAEVYARVEARIAPIYSVFNKQPAQPASAAATPVPAAPNATPPAFAGALNGTTPPAPTATTWDEKVANVMNDVLTKYNLPR